MNLRNRLLSFLLLLLIVVAAAAPGYRILGVPGVTPLDAVNMAVVTTATVGYSEIVDTSRNPPLGVEEVTVGANSPWLGKTIRGTAIYRHFELLALALRRA